MLTFFSLFHSAYAANLELSDEAGTALANLEVDPVCGFAIRYTHSVALTPVTDYFQARDDGIWLRKTEYSDFGAGLPHNPEGGQKMRVEAGKIVIENYDRKVSPFYVRVGRIAKHKLLLLREGAGGNCATERILPLETLVDPGQALKFDTKS